LERLSRISEARSISRPGSVTRLGSLTAATLHRGASTTADTVPCRNGYVQVEREV
jgi:hypothetical protein